MNTLQVDRALKHNTFTKKIFVGVFAADELPKLNTFPCGFVANTDPSTEPGTLGWHFISRHVKKENFSIVTATPLNIMDLNPMKSWSNVCGQYCIFYLYHKSRGYSMI